jgi:hypothetical protein
MQRLEEAPTEQARSWLDSLDGKLLERRMEAAAQKGCEFRNHYHVIFTSVSDFCPGYCQSVRVKVDFASWAKHRDLDETIGHSPNKKIGPLPLPKISIDDKPCSYILSEWLRRGRYKWSAPDLQNNQGVWKTFRRDQRKFQSISSHSKFLLIAHIGQHGEGRCGL